MLLTFSLTNFTNLHSAQCRIRLIFFEFYIILYIGTFLRILFLIIESFIDENEDNQNHVAIDMEILLSFIDKDVNAERCITTMLTSNRTLLEGPIGQKTVERFLTLLSNKGKCTILVVIIVKIENVVN